MICTERKKENGRSEGKGFLSESALQLRRSECLTTRERCSSFPGGEQLCQIYRLAFFDQLFFKQTSGITFFHLFIKLNVFLDFWYIVQVLPTRRLYLSLELQIVLLAERGEKRSRLLIHSVWMFTNEEI